MGDCTCCYGTTCVTSFFVLGILLFIFLYPDNPDIFIDNAFLTRFDLNNTSSDWKTVEYNLTVDVKLRNFNRQSWIQYYRLGVTAFFEGQKLAWSALSVFHQGPKNTTVLTVGMQGQSSVKMSGSGVGFFQTAAEAGVFILDFEVDGRLRFRTKGTKTVKDSFDTNCMAVLVPFNSNVTAAASSPAKSNKGFTFSPAQCQYPQDNSGGDV